MNKLYFLTIVGVATLLTGSILMSYSNIDNDSQLLNQVSEIVTLREWNSCVENKLPLACDDAPDNVHLHCYTTIIETNDCLLLTTPDSCKDFNTFSNDDSNLDKNLPQSFLDCVLDCETYAKQDTYFYNWYNLKYRTCSQA